MCEQGCDNSALIRGKNTISVLREDNEAMAFQFPLNPFASSNVPGHRFPLGEWPSTFAAFKRGSRRALCLQR